MTKLLPAPAPSVIRPDTGTRRHWRLPFSPWHLVLIPMTFILIVPLLWMLITSLETEGEANRFPPVLIPEHPRFENYLRPGPPHRSATSSSTAPW